MRPLRSLLKVMAAPTTGNLTKVIASYVILYSLRATQSVCSMYAKRLTANYMTSGTSGSPMYSSLNEAHVLKATHHVLLHRATVVCANIVITRMHSSRMRTARISSRRGDLHQAAPGTRPPNPPEPDPPRPDPPGTRHIPPGPGTPLWTDTHL